MTKEADDLFHQPPAGQQFVFIGIDPGATSGLAMYSKERGLRVQQVSFWKLIELLTEKILPAHKERRIQVKVIIKMNHKNKFAFKGPIMKSNRDFALTMARNFGMNQGYCKLMCEWFEHYGIEHEDVMLSDDKKYGRETFAQLTGINTLETNDHAREAARFISRYWLNKTQPHGTTT